MSSEYQQLLDVEYDEDERDEGDVAEQRCNRDPQVGIALVGLRIASKWRQHSNKNRDQRDREPERDRDRCPFRPLIRHRPQGSEDRRAHHERNPESKQRIRQACAVAPPVSGLEVSHLPQQRTGHGKLDGNYGLKY
jgi:hypothetical protein